MIGYDEQRAMIDAAMAWFPEKFGLASFPGDIFRIGRASSYVNDASVIMLYIERLVGGEWQAFSKGTEAELRASIRPLNSPAPVPSTEKPIRYDVIDGQTGKVVAHFKDGPMASRYCDRMDKEYGAVRFSRRAVWADTATGYSSPVSKVTLSPKSARAVEKHGLEECIKAYTQNQIGYAASTIAFNNGWQVKQANAAINAGREYVVFTTGHELPYKA